METILKIIHKIESLPKWLLILFACIFILRIPSFFEPYYYGDEMIYLTLGEGIRQGVPLYKDLHDNKPPLLYIVAAISGSVFWFKFILAIWMIVTVFVFWKFIAEMFPNKSKLHRSSTIIFAVLTTIPLFEGNIANAELFMIGPTIYAFYLLLYKKKSILNLLSAGVLFSISTLFKMPALFDILAIVFFWFSYTKLSKKGIVLTIKNLAIVFVGFITPILITLLWYFLRGAFMEYLVAAFLQNLGYLSTWSGKAKEDVPFLVKNSALLIKFGFAVFVSFILILKKKSLSKEFVFLTMWVLFSSFAVSLSERPYPHYFVQVLAPVSILFGLLINDKTLFQSLSLIPLGIAFFVPFYYKFWYYPTSSYYVRFVKLATRQITKDEYLADFNKILPRNYKIAKTITEITKRNDRIFVWGDSSQIYALSRRLPVIKYTADYHINDFYTKEMVISDLKKNPPVVVVILPEAPQFTELKQFVENKYITIGKEDSVIILKLLEPEVQSSIIMNSF